MRRRLAAVAILALALGGCGGTERSLPTPSPVPGGTGSPSISHSPVPTSPPGPTAAPSRPIPPAWATPIEGDVPPEDLDVTSLVPAEADPTSRVVLPAAGGVADQVAVAYVVGADPFAAEHGFAIWQRFDEPPAWSVVYAFVDAIAAGVLGIDVQSGDLTGDGHAETLTFEETGGSGACGRWRVVLTSLEDTRQVWSRRTCDTTATIADGALQVREAIFGPEDPHCCPGAFRTTTLTWEGGSFVETGVEESPGSPRPPG